MTAKYSVGWFLTRVLVALAIVGFVSMARAADKPAAQIQIGALLPLTGNLSVFGEQARVGIEMAMDAINANGGIGGRLLTVSFFDTQTDTELAVRGTLELLRKKKVLAVVGPITSGVRNAIMPLHKRYKTPLLYATNYEGNVCNRYLFSFNSVPNQELNALVPELLKQGGKRVYLIGNDYAWPRRLFRHARRLVKKHGGKVVGERFLPFGTDDFSDVVASVRQKRAGVVIKAIPGAEGIRLVSALNRERPDGPFAIGYLGLSELYLEAMSPADTRDLWVVTPFVQSIDSEPVTRLVQAAKKRADELFPVTHYMLTHYNAVMALGQALAKSRKPSRKALLKGLSGLKMQSVTGPLTISKKNRHASLPMFLAQASGETFRVVRSLGSVKAVNNCGVR